MRSTEQAQAQIAAANPRSTDPSTTEQIAAAVLAEHGEFYPDGCCCGGYQPASRDVFQHRDEHRAHQAQQIEARLDDGLRAGIEALADEWASKATPGQWSTALHPRVAAEQLRVLLDQTRTEADR